MKWLIFLAVAAFCLFGFLASFEPVEVAMVFRVGYAVGGVLCLLSAVGMILRKNG